MKDEYAIVLDFLHHGRASDRKAEPLVQAIGEKFLNLLEIVLRDDVKLSPGDRIYIGEEKREKVKYIRGRIDHDELTSFARNELNDVIDKFIDGDEKRFVNFFNIAGPITTRLHSLELLPGIGKKHLWDLITERRKKPFETFRDLQERVKMLPDPKRIVIKRIITELEGKDRYRLFVGSSRV